jgi:hypothetical protein
MNIFVFLIFLGIINIVFSFVWKWVFVLPGALLFAALKIDKGTILLKIFGAYLLVALTAITTLATLQDQNGWPLIVYPIVAAFVLFMGFASGSYEQQKQARIDNDWQMMQRIQEEAWLDPILMIGSVVLFVLSLFVPALVNNGLTFWLFDVIIWIYEIPVIGWILGIIGFFFMLSMIFYGTVVLLALVGAGVSKVKK